MADSIDFDYLQLASLNHQFDRISENQARNHPDGDGNNNDNDDDNEKQRLIELSLRALHLMEKYAVLQPRYDKFIKPVDDDATYSVLGKYNHDWVDANLRVNDPLVGQLETEFRNLLLYPSTNPSVEVSDLPPHIDTSQQPDMIGAGSSTKKDLFARFKKVLIINIIKRNFSENIHLINTYSSINQFNLNPKDLNQIRSNNFLQYLFFQYYNNLNEFLWSGTAPTSSSSSGAGAGAGAATMTNNTHYFPGRLSRMNSSNSKQSQHSPVSSDMSSSASLRGGTSSNPSSLPTVGSASSANKTAAFKVLDAILIRATNYYTKIEPFLSKINKSATGTTTDDESSPVFEEIYYYWLIRFYNLTILFKKFEFYEFNNEFQSLFLDSSSSTSSATSSGATSNASSTAMGFSSSSSAVTTTTVPNPALQFLIQLPTLKSDIFSMYGIVSLFIKPFKALSYLDNDILIDIFNTNESAFDATIYNHVLSPLSNSKFANVHHTLLSPQFSLQLSSNLDYLLPASDKQANSSSSYKFINYIIKIIDFKSFLMIISVTNQIPRMKLFEILGYKDSSPEKLSNLTAIFLHLMGILGLGKLGVGYNIEKELFFNEQKGVDHKLSNDLQGKINDLTNDVYGESIATLLKSILTERIVNVYDK